MSSRQATAVVDLDAIRFNFQLAKSFAPASQIMAVIKADAYGHGAVQTAQALSEADAFAVARVSEAVKLREAGIGQPICLLEGVTDREELNLASVFELQVVVHSQYQIDLMKAAGARRPVWIKVDTGMSRLGFDPAELAQVVTQLDSQNLLGLMTHLSHASDRSSDITSRQLALIRALADRQRDVRLKTMNIANSAGIMSFPDVHADWVRPGLMLYGASPFDDLRPLSELMPAMTFSAPVIAVHPLKQGASVGYGGIYTATADIRVAVVAAGYADGYPREIEPGTPVLINGEQRPIVGRVSMDMVCVALSPGDQVDPGDRAVLWGEGLALETVAKASGTIPYTLMSGVTARVYRHYRGKNPRG